MPTDESHPLAESNHQINSLVDRIQSLGTKRWIRSTSAHDHQLARLVLVLDVLADDIEVHAVAGLDHAPEDTETGQFTFANFVIA